MSISYHTYIGPYIEVYNPKLPAKKEYFVCKNKNCGEYKIETSNKFCPECGEEIKLILSPCKLPIEFDVYYEFDDKLYEISPEYPPKDDYMLFAANKKGSGITHDNGFGFIEINESMITNQIEKMTNEYKKEIFRLKDIFRIENVVVKWGVISYCS